MVWKWHTETLKNEVQHHNTSAYKCRK